MAPRTALRDELRSSPSPLTIFPRGGRRVTGDRATAKRSGYSIPAFRFSGFSSARRAPRADDIRPRTGNGGEINCGRGAAHIWRRTTVTRLQLLLFSPEGTFGNLPSSPCSASSRVPNNALRYSGEPITCTFCPAAVARNRTDHTRACRSPDVV